MIFIFTISVAISCFGATVGDIIYKTASKHAEHSNINTLYQSLPYIESKINDLVELKIDKWNNHNSYNVFSTDVNGIKSNDPPKDQVAVNTLHTTKQHNNIRTSSTRTKSFKGQTIASAIYISPTDPSSEPTGSPNGTPPAGMPQTSAPSPSSSAPSGIYYYYYISPTGSPSTSSSPKESRSYTQIPTLATTTTPTLLRHKKQTSSPYQTQQHHAQDRSIPPTATATSSPTSSSSSPSQLLTPSSTSTSTPHPTLIPTSTVSDHPTPTPINYISPSPYPSPSLSIQPTGLTSYPTPGGSLGQSWWYLTMFRCTLWGLDPPTHSYQTRPLLTAVQLAVDFVLRDRMGLTIDTDPDTDPQDLGNVDSQSSSVAVLSEGKVWVQASLPQGYASRVSSEKDGGGRGGSGSMTEGEDDDDDGGGETLVGTVVDVKVWMTMENSLEEVSSVLHSISTQPEILVGPLHQHNYRTVTSVSIRILNETITTEPPPETQTVDVYEQASRIAWIIAGTVGLFGLSLVLIGTSRACCAKDGPCSCRRLIRRVREMMPASRYGQFRSTPLRDLDEFQLDDEEVTIELQEM
eukprot:gene1738-3357_t